MYEPEWFRTWTAYHEKQLDICKWIYYVSDCEVLPNVSNELTNTEVIYSAGNHGLNVHSHDAHASMLVPATYAYCNEMNFIYIEQDCLVKGLDSAIKWASDKDLCYGYGKWSLSLGWAEQCFIWVRYEYIPMFVYLCMKSNIMNVDVHRKVIPEPMFHGLFKNIVTPWPFGVGRKRPIGFNDDIVYAQQLTDNELNEFLK